MIRKFQTMSRVLNFVARHSKIASLIGIAIFLPDLLKVFIKGISDTDSVDIGVLALLIVVYLIFLYIVRLIKKKFSAD